MEHPTLVLPGGSRRQCKQSLLWLVVALMCSSTAALLVATMYHRPVPSPMPAPLVLTQCHASYPSAPAAMPQPKVTSAQEDLKLQSEKDQAMQIFMQDMDMAAGATQQAAIYVERQFDAARPEEIKEINIQSRSGDVRIMHRFNPEHPRILYVVGKIAAAEDYARARQYSKQMMYTAKRDGEKVTISLSRPSSTPKDVFGDVHCLLLVPPGVKVNVNSAS